MSDSLKKTYFPLFSTRPAEIRAYREFEKKKLHEKIIPTIVLTREREAPSLDSSLSSVLQIANGRPIIVDFDPTQRTLKTPQEIQAARAQRAEQRIADGKEPYNPSKKMEERWNRQREITIDFNRTLIDLQSSVNGYENWLKFSLSKPNIIPIVQTTDPAQIASQVLAIIKENRKMAFRLDLTNPGSLASFLVAAPHIDKADRVILILDAGYIRGAVTGAEVRVTRALNSIQANIPDLFSDLVKVCMAGSFPASLAGLTSPLDIEERTLFDRVVSAGWDVRYGDHSSVQPRSGQEGGNGYFAHVEVAHQRQWHFDRSDKKSKSSEFVTCAKKLVNDSIAWGGRCTSWGTDMVKRVSQGILDDGEKPPLKFTGPGPWVGIRMNQHITQQALHP